MARKKAIEPMDVAAYARRVNLTHGAIQKAIKTGRLTRSVVWVDGTPKIADADQADAELEANTRPRIDRPERTDADGTVEQSYNRSRAEREAALARLDAHRADLAAIELEEKRGSVVAVEVVEARLTSVFSACRSKLLGVPTRARQRDPGLTPAQVALIEELVREALEDLSSDGASE